VDITSRSPIDVLTGMLVFTYPLRRCDVDILRPYGFTVAEIVNSVSAANLFYDLIGEFKSRELRVNRDRCYWAFYIVRKVHVDSWYVCNLMMEHLRCSKCLYLGMKDADAIAYQVIALNGCKDLREIFEYEDVSAVLWFCSDDARGALIHQGNEFEVKVKFSEDDAECFSDALRRFERKGYMYVLNFYGYQRFGVFRPITHILGMYILKREWSKFLDLLCGFPFPSEKDVQALLFRLHASGLTSAQFKVPRSLALERVICSPYLAGNYNGELELIKKLPRYAIELFVQAYQSYLFNILLSKIWYTNVKELGVDRALDRLSKEFIPVVGYDTKNHIEPRSNGYSGLLELLDVEGLRFEDFIVRELSIKLPGDFRKALIEVEDFKLVTISSGEAIFSFRLPRGSYATVVIRELCHCTPMEIHRKESYKQLSLCGGHGIH